MIDQQKKEKARQGAKIVLYYLPLATAVLFAFYNLFLYIRHGVVWNISIFGYYLLLSCLQGLVLLGNSKTKDWPAEKRANRRYVLFMASSILLLVINAALVVPISLLAMHQKDVSFGLIPAIAMAAYTTYKITMAILGYKRGRKDDNLLVRESKTIGLMDAGISLLSLQNTLIMVNGGSDATLTWIVCISSFAVLAFILSISILSFVRGIKSHKEKQIQE